MQKRIEKEEGETELRKKETVKKREVDSRLVQEANLSRRAYLKSYMVEWPSLPFP